MGRRKIRDENTKRISFELLGDNYKACHEWMNTFGLRMATLMNLIISTFSNISPDMRESISDFCVTRVAELQEVFISSQSRYRQKIQKDINQYRLIYKLINKGKELVTVKNVKMKGVEIEIPSSCVEVNPESAKKSKHAYIVECRNAIRYGIPRFVVYSNHEGDITTDFYNECINLCVNAWGDFESVVLDNQVTPQYNRYTGSLMNSYEYFNYPAIEIFHISSMPKEDI